MRTSNPALKDDTFNNLESSDSVMTLQGTALKTLFLVLLVVIAGAFTWHLGMEALAQIEPGIVETEGKTNSLTELPAIIWQTTIAGSLIGFVVGMICIFCPKKSPILAPTYAILEGIALGGFSAMFEYMYPGIVIQAVCCTVGTLTALLAIYLTGLIKPTENFKLGLCAAMFGILIYYLAAIGLGMFGIAVPLIHDTGWMGIGFSVFVIIIAALNLVLDFDFIENGVEQQAPKYMEWYAGFGLLVTLVWLYLEFLRLLAKLRSK